MPAFQPYTEEELDRMTMIPPGIYNAEIISAEEKFSKSGNEMIELIAQIRDGENEKRVVYDWLVFKNHPLCIRKIKHFCESAGLSETYKSGRISGGMCANKRVIIDISEKDGKNQVNGYKTSHSEPIQNQSAPESKAPDPYNDDVPF